MSWSFSRLNEEYWEFNILTSDAKVSMKFPGGGWTDDIEEYTIYSVTRVGMGFNYPHIYINNENQTVAFMGTGYGHEAVFPEVLIKLPEESYKALKQYVDSLNHNAAAGENQLYEYEYRPGAAAPAPPAAPAAPAALSVPVELSETRNFEYIDIPNVSDIMEGDEKLLTDVANPDNVIFKHGPLFFAYSKENLRDLNDHSRIVFECKQQLVGGAPIRNQIHEDRPYFNLPGPHMNYLIPYGQLLSVIEHPLFQTFELIQSADIANSASYLAVIDAEGRGLDGQRVDLVGMDHCTAGTNKPVFTVHTLRLSAAAAAQEGGHRKRRTLRCRQHNRRRSRRL